MDRGTVFYSWQSDSSPKVTRNLIERALEMAAQRTNAALDAGYAGSGFMVRPLLPLFAHFDPLYMGWNPDRDARQLAVELMRRDGFHVTTLGDELRWPARRMNPAIFRLLQGMFARASDEVPGASLFCECT